MKLYEINSEIARIIAEIDEETGEITEEQFRQLDSLSIQREVKIENTAFVIKQMRGEAEVIEAERKRLQAKEAAAKNRVTRLQDYLQDMLAGEKYKSPLNNIYYGTSQAVNIVDLEKIPCEFMIAQDPKIDKQGIRAALKNGQVVEGAELEENRYMVIR